MRGMDGADQQICNKGHGQQSRHSVHGCIVERGGRVKNSARGDFQQRLDSHRLCVNKVGQGRFAGPKGLDESVLWDVRGQGLKSG